MEIRSPCNSSSQTFSTVPAFRSASTTALPINSDCVAPYSFKIFDARRITDGIARPCSAQPSVLSKAVQRRRLSQRSAAGTIDGDCSSNSRSRSICVLRLPGHSGSSFRTARSHNDVRFRGTTGSERRAVKVTRLTRCGHRPDRNLAVRRALIWILPIRCYAVTWPRAAHAFRSAEETSFTCGARSPDPWELMLIRLAKRWEQECSRKGSRPWA